MGRISNDVDGAGPAEALVSLADRDIQQLENEGYSDAVDEIMRLRRDNLDARLVLEEIREWDMATHHELGHFAMPASLRSMVQRFIG